MEADVVVAGGGIVGASLAAALAEHGRRIVVIERAQPEAPLEAWQSRIYTLTPASIGFLERVGAWGRIEAERATNIGEMQVHGDDSRSRLSFSAYESGMFRLAATVEATRLQHALWQGLDRRHNVTLLCPAVLRRIRHDGESVVVELESGQVLTASLLVGADGAHSWVRSAAGIEIVRHGYGQLGVVANFSCTLEHRGIARQWFREDGVLAYLPLPGRRVSIVWSTDETHARELLSLAPSEFAARVGEAGRHALGSLELISQPEGFPLSSLEAQTLTRARVALVGDAAHVVHPLAGQGVNLGLGDAHCLADLISDAPDPGDRSVLRRYERARSGDILALRLVIHGLYSMFSSKDRVTRGLRNFGLNFVNSTAVLKTLMTRRAVAVGGGLHYKEFS